MQLSSTLSSCPPLTTTFQRSLQLSTAQHRTGRPWFRIFDRFTFQGKTAACLFRQPTRGTTPVGCCETAVRGGAAAGTYMCTWCTRAPHVPCLRSSTYSLSPPRYIQVCGARRPAQVLVHCSTEGSGKRPSEKQLVDPRRRTAPSVKRMALGKKESKTLGASVCCMLEHQGWYSLRHRYDNRQ